TGVTYQWYLNGTQLSNATNRFHTATASGYYYVVITQNNCVAQSADTYIDIEQCFTGIDKIEAEQINIFPNPNNGTFKVVADLATKNAVQLKLLTTLGQVVY